MVIFRRPDGKPGYHQADGVEDAVRFVEMLRNQEKVTDARVFRMEEVALEVRTYFKVEVASEESEVPAATPTPASAPLAVPPSVANAMADSPPADAAEPLDPMPVEVGAGKGRGRFGRN